MEKKKKNIVSNGVLFLKKDSNIVVTIDGKNYPVMCKKNTKIEQHDDGKVKSFVPKDNLTLKGIDISGIKQDVTITKGTVCELYEDGKIKSFVPKDDLTLENIDTSGITQNFTITGDIVCELYEDGKIKSFVPKDDLTLEGIDISGIKQNVTITKGTVCKFYENGKIKSFVPKKKANLILNINDKKQQIVVSGDSLASGRKCKFYEDGKVKSFTPTSGTKLDCKICNKEQSLVLDHFKCKFYNDGQINSFNPKGDLVLKDIDIFREKQNICIKNGKYCKVNENGQLESFYPNKDLLLKGVNISGEKQDIKIKDGELCELYENGNLKSCNVADNIDLYNLKINGCEEKIITVSKNTNMSLYENGNIKELRIKKPIKYSTNILNDKISISGTIEGHTSFDESGNITNTYAQQMTANLCFDKNKKDINISSNKNFKIKKYDKDKVFAFLGTKYFIHDDGDYFLVSQNNDKKITVDIYKRNKDKKNYTFIGNKDLDKFKSNGYLDDDQKEFFYHVTDNFYKKIKPELEKKEMNNGETNYYNIKCINPSERLMLKDC